MVSFFIVQKNCGRESEGAYLKALIGFGPPPLSESNLVSMGCGPGTSSKINTVVILKKL